MPQTWGPWIETWIITNRLAAATAFLDSFPELPSAEAFKGCLQRLPF